MLTSRHPGPDALARKRSRSFSGHVQTVPYGVAYSEPRPTHRRSSSSAGQNRVPYFPPPGSGSSSSHHERGRYHSTSGRHPADFASVVPANIGSAGDPYAAKKRSASASRPAPSRRSTWHPPPPNPAFAPSVKIHRALACTRSPALLYDIKHPPAHDNILTPSQGSSLLSAFTRRKSTPTAPVPAHTLALPATRPFVPELPLALPAMPGVPTEWSVRAVSRSSTDPSHTALTNLDVLHAVYAAMRAPVSRREWDALGAGSSAQKRVAEAYKIRCEELGDQREWEAGIRRSDFLCGRTVFWGVDCRADGVCELVFSKP